MLDTLPVTEQTVKVNNNIMFNGVKYGLQWIKTDLRRNTLVLLLLLLLVMSRIRVMLSHSCGGTLQNLDLKLLHSSMQTSADHRSRRRHVSRMTDKKGDTWTPSRMSKVRSRPESLVADCAMHVLQPPDGSSTSRRHL